MFQLHTRTWTRAVVLFTALLAPLFIAPLHASDLDQVSVMALGPLDGRAVIRGADGKLTVLKLGDIISGTNARVIQVLPDRLVLEDRIAKADSEPVLETVWLYKADTSGRSEEKRFSLDPPPQPTVEVPN